MVIVYHVKREEFGFLYETDGIGEISSVNFGDKVLNVSSNQLKVLETEKFFDYVNTLQKNFKPFMIEE